MYEAISRNTGKVYFYSMLNIRKGGCVYILSSPDKTALYTGVSSELENRILQHREKIHSNSFSAKYRCTLLIYFKYFDSIEEAIAEEKRIKGGSRKRKLALINSINPEWHDLWVDLDKFAW